MKFRDLFELILYNLNRRKGRVALTAVGVVIGTAAVVVLVSLAVGLQKTATSQLYGINDLTSIEVYPGYGMSSSAVKVIAVGGGGGGGGGSSQDSTKYLTPTAIQSIAAIPNVKRVVTEDYLQASADMVFGKLHAYTSIVGVDVADLVDMGLDSHDCLHGFRASHQPRFHRAPVQQVHASPGCVRSRADTQTCTSKRH